MDKQIKVYSIDTSAFYNEEERRIHRSLNARYFYKDKIIKKRNKAVKQVTKLKKQNINNQIMEKSILNTIDNIDLILPIINKEINQLKKELKYKMNSNTKMRTLRKSELRDKDVVSIFDSTLIRTIGIPINTLTDNLIIVRTFYFKILKDLILNGFMYRGEKYVCFTASAGQIRTKKTIFIKESIYLKIKDALTCGLSVDNINRQGGVNINKYLAYLALCNSATDEWKNFDITKTIVVDDMETEVYGKVDFIDDRTYIIERKNMSIPIEHTDGCGMVLPKVTKKSMMIRLPWVKGLLVPFPFDKFIREANRNNPNKKHEIIKDIYGKEHDILKEKIEVIFTKSQFKMWKYYKDWDEYIHNYKKYGCQAGYCNKEEDKFPNAKINYQMLQTLTDITDYELEKICQKTITNIMNVGRDRETMLRILGVTEYNTNKNYLQQALEIYPELLQDTYSKEILKQTKKSLVKKARAGKVDIKGKYTFICPDLYAFCEWLFLNDKNPKGLLKNGEVYCRLYNDGMKLDCLRSPHLYREHAVRMNVVDKERGRWFITNGLYTSCYDLISKILMFDVDGDTSLVCSDKTLVEVAERNMKGIVPLYYNMAKAGAEEINNENIYKGMINAYTGGNIGVISNNITKIWNNENPDIDMVKLLCLENNFTIDYAKTLYKPTRPKHINRQISKYTNLKPPHFFIYAKDKNRFKVDKINNSTVNRLKKIIPNPRIKFKATNLGEFDYTMLMRNEDINIYLHSELIKEYNKQDLKRYFMLDKNIENKKYNNIKHTYDKIRERLLLINDDIYEVTDVLVKYLYEHKKSSYKATLWECFGDIIVKNLKNNITQPLDEGWIQCEVCGKRIKVESNRQKYCDGCLKNKQLEWDREYQKKKYYAKM